MILDMALPKNLLPELALWNGGAGIALDDWIYCVGRSDHALGYFALAWPEFEVFEGYVLRGPLDIERLRGWENASLERKQIEICMNMSALELAFPDEDADAQLKAARLKTFAVIISEIWGAKLRRDFPERSFSVVVIDNEDDFGVSFHQT
jgi:hypothetical protein